MSDVDDQGLRPSHVHPAKDDEKNTPSTPKGRPDALERPSPQEPPFDPADPPRERD